MKAGLDEVIKLWDLRNISRPVTSYHGHVPGNGSRRLKQIHRPTFLSTASSLDLFILSGGEGSHAVSMFQLVERCKLNDSDDNDEGEVDSPRSVFSRGKLPEDVGDVGSLAICTEKCTTFD